MARLTTEDDFFDICGQIAPLIGSMDAAIGQAMRFRRLAQSRSKQNKIITKTDFITYGFHSALIGTFAAEVGGGFVQLYNNTEHNWIRNKVAAGKKGGASKSEKKTKNLKQNAAPLPCDSNNLAPKHTEAQSKPLPLSLSLSQVAAGKKVKSPQQIQFEEKYKQELSTQASNTSINKHWLRDLWNQNCGALPKLEEIDVETRKRINAAVKKTADRELWLDAIKKVAASNFCNGKGRKPFHANFFWLVKPGIRERIASGVYSENNAPLIETSKASDWGRAAASTGIKDKKALAEIFAANQAVLKKSAVVS